MRRQLVKTHDEDCHGNITTQFSSSCHDSINSWPTTGESPDCSSIEYCTPSCDPAPCSDFELSETLCKQYGCAWKQEEEPATKLEFGGITPEPTAVQSPPPIIEPPQTGESGSASPMETKDGLSAAGAAITILVTLVAIILLGLLILCCLYYRKSPSQRPRQYGRPRPTGQPRHRKEETIVMAPIVDDIECLPPATSAPSMEEIFPQVVTTTVEHEDGSITEKTETTYANGTKSIKIVEKPALPTVEAFVIPD